MMKPSQDQAKPPATAVQELSDADLDQVAGGQSIRPRPQHKTHPQGKALTGSDRPCPARPEANPLP